MFGKIIILFENFYYLQKKSFRVLKFNTLTFFICRKFINHINNQIYYQMKKVLFLFIVLTFTLLNVDAQSTGNTGYWDLNGNTGTSSSNFIGTISNQPLIFKTRGDEQMRLLSDRPFLGIGITTPEATLHLHNPQNNGQIPLLQLTTNATGNAATNGFAVFSDFDTKDITLKQQESAKFFIEGPGGGLVLAQDGNVGFGTDAPQEKVHIKDGNLLLTASSGAGNSSIFFRADHTEDKRWNIERTSSGLDFSITRIVKPQHGGIPSFTQLPILFLGENRSIGIGTQDPTTKLEVAGSFKATSAEIAGALTAQSANITGTITANALKVQSLSFNFADTVNTKVLNAQTAKVSGNTILMGNVGIGKTDPQRALDVNGSIGLPLNSSLIWGHTINPGNNRLRLTHSGTHGYIDYKDNLHFRADIASVSALTLYGNGSVGIGFETTYDAGNYQNMGYKLAVNGSLGAQSADINGKLNAQSATINGNLSIKEGSYYSVSFGNAGGQNLGWGTSYIGFNATRNNSAENWTVEGDGAHNGSSVIWSNVQGDICFASIPSTNGNNKTLSDLNIKNNIKLQLLSNGILKAKEVQVTLSGWPDYVFSKDYNLLPLSEVEQFIAENHHLPDVPSAAEVEANGINIGEMNAILLKKVEELTLHIIQQEKKIADLQVQIEIIKNN